MIDRGARALRVIPRGALAGRLLVNAGLVAMTASGLQRLTPRRRVPPGRPPVTTHGEQCARAERKRGVLDLFPNLDISLLQLVESLLEISVGLRYEPR
jgi:hypothetical protein